MKHVVITGGSGFIGSHLCDLFLSRGYAVTAIDNLVTGRRKNIEQALLHPEFDFIEQDVCDDLDETKLKLFKRHKRVDGVLHFACPASPIDFEKIPFVILKVDSVGTMKTVELAQRHGARYLVASTSEVYGDPLEHPQKETYWGNVNSIGIRACYDEAKRFAEAYVSTAIRLGTPKLNGAIVRIFNTYGPRMRPDDGRIVPELCMQGLSGAPLTIHGEGLQTRSFCFVSDLVDGIFKLFESSEHDPVNIGNPVERTVLDFAKAVQKLTGEKSKLNHLPARADDPRRRCPDISRAQKILNWTPKVSFEEGLMRTVEHFKTEK